MQVVREFSMQPSLNELKARAHILRGICVGIADELEITRRLLENKVSQPPPTPPPLTTGANILVIFIKHNTI